jgi:hypothetical protein
MGASCNNRCPGRRGLRWQSAYCQAQRTDIRSAPSCVSPRRHAACYTPLRRSCGLGWQTRGMQREALPSGARILVAARMLIAPFAGRSLAGRAWRPPGESRQVEAFTGEHMLLASPPRLRVLEALHTGVRPGGPPARKLRKPPERSKSGRIIRGCDRFRGSAAAADRPPPPLEAPATPDAGRQGGCPPMRER